MGDGLDLLTDPIELAGDPVDTTRQRPNGRFTEADAVETDFGVDRTQDGLFASKDRDPVAQVRHDDGEFGADAFAVGNFGEFDSEGRFDTGGGGRR